MARDGRPRRGWPGRRPPTMHTLREAHSASPHGTLAHAPGEHSARSSAMASVGHIAVSMAASRVHDRSRGFHWPTAVSWAALSMLPDADVIGLPLGVAYTAPWGHRGATHSFVF